MKTFSLKPKDIKRQWYLLDASEVPLGRLASQAARLIIGKHKVSLTPHIDGGDHVIIINASNLIVTGNKRSDKIYYRHSGFPGGLSSRTLDQALQKDPAKVISHAISNMLPVNKLRDQRLRRLKIYLNDEHEHAAQKPQSISLAKSGSKQ